MYYRRIAIFASGKGSNALNLVRYFNLSNSINNIKVETVFVNNPNAEVISKMKNENVPVFLFDKEMLYKSDRVLEELKLKNIDFVVLAGFLWLVPNNILNLYSKRIINIHPALLPKYGGKGMYGSKVHEAVINNKEKYSGITIHEVNEEYDKGKILFQASCVVLESDTPQCLANRIHKLEYFHFPKVVQAWVMSFK